MASGIYLIGRDIDPADFVRKAVPIFADYGVKIETVVGIPGPVRYSAVRVVAARSILISARRCGDNQYSLTATIADVVSDLAKRDTRLEKILKENAKKLRQLGVMQESEINKDELGAMMELEAELISKSLIGRDYRGHSQLLVEVLASYRDRKAAERNLQWAYEHLLPQYQVLRP